MKRFQKLTIILASLALLLMLAVGVRSSVAYFTSYAEGQGGETVQLVHWERLDEEVIGTSKSITITNPEYDPENGRPTQPVFIRARAFVGDLVESYFSYTGAAPWRDGGDGWWYYDEVLYPGDTTAPALVAELADIPVDENGALILQDGGIEMDQNQLNMVVVFESTLALYDYQEDGTYVPFAYWGTLQDEGHTVIEGGAQS